MYNIGIILAKNEEVNSLYIVGVVQLVKNPKNTIVGNRFIMHGTGSGIYS
jgi:hypothetical protein